MPRTGCGFSPAAFPCNVALVLQLVALDVCAAVGTACVSQSAPHSIASKWDPFSHLELAAGEDNLHGVLVQLARRWDNLYKLAVDAGTASCKEDHVKRREDGERERHMAFRDVYSIESIESRRTVNALMISHDLLSIEPTESIRNGKSLVTVLEHD